MRIQGGSSRKALLAVTICVTVAGLGLSEASAADAGGRSFKVKTPHVKGPAKFDRAFVTAYGKRRAKNVLILMPGTFGGAGDFTLAAKNLVKRNKKLQVWALDRREQALEDTSMFERGMKGKATLQEVFDYYLVNSLSGTSPSYKFADTTKLGFARNWGMKTVLNDTRAVVKRARRSGKRVVLGGHSVGASLAISYAAWDFHGRPGYKDLKGLVLIDGGLLGSFDPYNLRQAKAAMAKIKEDAIGPFSRLIEGLPPETAGLFAGVGGQFAKRAPHARATELQGYPLLPDNLKPPYPATNQALFGYDFDRNTSPPELTSLHVNAGHIEPEGPGPADWVDGGITPIRNLRNTFSQQPVNAVDWFFPTRITIDANGADKMKMNPVARYLGLRLKHTRKVNLPFYVVQTDDTGGDVLKGARNWIRRTKTRKRQSVLINADPRMSHLDPLMATPRKNVFLKTVTPFLRKAFASRGNRRP